MAAIILPRIDAVMLGLLVAYGAGFMMGLHYGWYAHSFYQDKGLRRLWRWVKRQFGDEHIDWPDKP